MKLISPLALALALGISAGAIRAQGLTPEEVRQRTALYARVLTAQKYVEAVEQTCGPVAEGVAAIWNSRNAHAVARANALRAETRAQIVAAAGTPASQALEDRQDEYLAARISRELEPVEALPAEKKRLFCERYLALAQNGRLDVAVPEAKELVQIPLAKAQVTVEVTVGADGWSYDMTYDGATAKGIEHVMLLPRGEPVRFSARSTDVIHSLRFTDADIEHIDALPKLESERNIVFEEGGVIAVGCDEGHPHSDQDMIAISVVEQDEFEEWVRTIAH